LDFFRLERSHLRDQVVSVVMVARALQEEPYELRWLVWLGCVGTTVVHRQEVGLALQSKHFFAKGLAEVDRAEIWARRVLRRAPSSKNSVSLLHRAHPLAFPLPRVRGCHSIRLTLLCAAGMVRSALLLFRAAAAWVA